MSETTQWRRCNACKEPIAFGSTYWVCSVSTCNRKRTGMAFCTVSCWEVHVPVARHRDAGAIEKVAPTREEAEALRREEAAGASRAPRRRIAADVPVRTPPVAPAASDPDVPREILIVASRLKDYVRARSGFNTSERVLGPLSDAVRELCDRAIENARRDERKTVLDRDVPRG